MMIMETIHTVRDTRHVYMHCEPLLDLELAAAQSAASSRGMEATCIACRGTFILGL